MGSWTLTLDLTKTPTHQLNATGFIWRFPDVSTSVLGTQSINTFYFFDVATITMDLTAGTWVNEKVTQIVFTLNYVITGGFYTGTKLKLTPLNSNIIDLTPPGNFRLYGGSNSEGLFAIPVNALTDVSYTKTFTGAELAGGMQNNAGNPGYSYADPRFYTDGSKFQFQIHGWVLSPVNPSIYDPNPLLMSVQLTTCTMVVTSTTVLNDPDVGGSGTDTTSWRSGWAQH